RRKGASPRHCLHRPRPGLRMQKVGPVHSGRPHSGDEGMTHTRWLALFLAGVGPFLGAAVAGAQTIPISSPKRTYVPLPAERRYDFRKFVAENGQKLTGSSSLSYERLRDLYKNLPPEAQRKLLQEMGVKDPKSLEKVSEWNAKPSKDLSPEELARFKKDLEKVT